MGKDVGVEHDDDADDGGEGDGVPEDEAEDGAFVADLVGGGGGDADGLRVDHFAHDAAGAVGGAHEDGTEIQLLRGNFLQAAEEHVGRSVAAGESDAEPADERAEEWEEPSSARERKAEDGVHAGVAGDVAEAEHAGHGDDGESQSKDGAAEDVQNFSGLEAEDEGSNECGEEAACPGGSEPVEIEARAFGNGLGDDGNGAKHFVVKIGPVPTGGAGARFAVGQSDLESGSGGFVHCQLDGRKSPAENEDRKNGEGQPGFGGLARGVMLDDVVASDFGGVFFALVFKTPDAFGLPDAEKKHGGDERDDARGDVDEIAVHIIGPEELCGGERNANDENGGEDFNSFRPTDHGPHEPEGHDDGGDGENAADHGVEIAFGKSGDGGERVNGSADGAPSDGSGIGDEIERGGVEGFEAEADHESTGDGDGRAETCAAFDEGAEAESDEEKLEAAVGRDGGDGVLHDFKLAGLDGDVVEKNGGDDDPDDF